MEKSMTATEEFKFIIKVLKSCETKEQVESSVNMLENFKNKWKRKLECLVLVDFISKFTLEIKNICETFNNIRYSQQTQTRYQ
jgi:hypothetical protein